MADLSKLEAAIADLSAKFNAFMNKSAVEALPVVDDQPAIDAAAAQLEAIAAKIPA